MVTLLAALLSTAAALLLAAVSHISVDLMRILHQTQSPQGALAFSRAMILLLGSGALLVALYAPNVVEILIFSYTLYTSGVFIPLIGGLYWRGATRTGALVSLVLGSVVCLVAVLHSSAGSTLPLEAFGLLGGLFASLSSFVLVSVLFR